MIRRLTLVLAVLVGGWLVACAFLFVWPSSGAGTGKADAVIVLSGDENHRLDPGLALVRRGVAPVLVISSAALDPKWRKAHVLCAHPDQGRFRVVCFNAHPYSTQGEARAIERLARAHGWRRVVVVTSTFHITRARLLITRCYHGKLAMIGARSTWWRLPEEWASETGKLLVQLTVRRGC